MNETGIWKKEKTLGAGGFGTVSLYVNKETRETLALKICRLTNEMTERHKQRWHKEVEIMLKLNHPNVVNALRVPEELECPPGEMPAMAMEYCQGGDLRKVLNKPENCCGLKEDIILAIVHDISAAIEYLHSARIIHRDLKPENIVLQNIDEQTVYKVIDLGYAKDLDQGSVCTSFVGTLQYLAPELFDSQKYTCTVDYWSFGTMVFECINGYRPMLPTLAPLQWHSHVKKKKNEDICLYFDTKGQITSSSQIPKPNHLSRIIQTCFEQLLRHLLIWNPNQRGGGLTAKKRPKWYELIDAMMKIKIVFIFSVPTNQVLSYQVVMETLGFLQTVIQQETGIPVEEQEFLLGSGMPPDISQPAAQHATDKLDSDGLIFLFHGPKRSVQLQFKPQVMPDLVQDMLAEPNIMYTFQEQKKIWSHAVYFISEVKRDHKRLLQAQRAVMMALLRTNSEFSKQKSALQKSLEHLMAKIDFYRASLSLDLKMYENQAKNGVSSCKLYNQWKAMKADIPRAESLKSSTEQLDQLCTAIMTRILELQRSPFAKAKQNDSLDTLESRATAHYDKFRQTSKDKRHLAPENAQIVQCLNQCLKERERLAKDLYTHIGKVLECHNELHRLLPQITQKQAEISKLIARLHSNQDQRQCDLWYLLRLVVQQRSAESSHTPTFQDASAQTEAALVVNPTTTKNKSNSVDADMFFQKCSYDSLIVLSESVDTRTRMEEIVKDFEREQSDCPSLVETFDWGFLETERCPVNGKKADLLNIG